MAWGRVPHFASHLLAQCLRRLSFDWEQLYRHPVLWVETFVDGERFKGTCLQGRQLDFPWKDYRQGEIRSDPKTEPFYQGRLWLPRLSGSSEKGSPIKVDP